MDKHIRILILLLCAAALLAAVFLMFRRQSFSFQPSREAFPNPLIGYAPMPSSKKLPAEDIRLRYVGLLWRELEPEEGVFDWEGLEEKYQLSQLREQGVHLVLRFVCDEPGDEFHLDIPQWLYDKTGDGTAYTGNGSTGKGRCGYSPNYENPVFIRAHAAAVAALGEHFRDDTLVSYIELGSLGHWGEWHVTYLPDDIDDLPGPEIRLQYVTPWLEAFPQAKLLMRRPFAPAKTYGLGVYNDMAGVAHDTEVWLDWIENGGSYHHEPDGLAAIPKVWEYAPVGGEMASRSYDDLLVTNLEETLSLIRDSHMSFLGPHAPYPEYKEGYDAISLELGYRLTVKELTVMDSPFFCRAQVTFGNDGAAPMYFDWPVRLYLESENGLLLRIFPVDLKLSTLLPGQIRTVSVPLPGIRLTDELQNGARLSLGIIDPMTGTDSIRLAIDCPYENGRNVLVK